MTAITALFETKPWQGRAGLTRAFALPASTVVGLAQADLALRRKNIDIGRRRKKHYHVYSFHRAHVREAVDALDLIRRARAELEMGEASTKRATRIIYDAATLKRALRLAERNAKRAARVGA